MKCNLHKLSDKCLRIIHENPHKYRELLEHNSPRTVDKYLTRSNYGFNVGDLEDAVENNDVDLLTQVLADPRVDPSADNNYTIRLASDSGHTEIVERLLADPRVDPSALNNEAIRLASENGYTEIVEILLADPRVDVFADNNWGIKFASKKGHTEIVQILLADPRVDPSADNNLPIRFASKNGHTEIVKMLLSDPRVDPSADNNWAIIVASQNGHTEIVKMLLTHPRVDPSAKDNEAIIVASEKGHTEIVQILLGDSRVDPSADNNYAIIVVSDKGHIDIVRMLLADPRVDPSANNNEAIRDASENGYTEIVQILLADPRVDPSAIDNWAIKWASEKGHIEIVKMLLTHPRVDPSADDNWAIRVASRNGHTEIVEMLSKDVRVIQSLLNKIPPKNTYLRSIYDSLQYNCPNMDIITMEPIDFEKGKTWISKSGCCYPLMDEDKTFKQILENSSNVYDISDLCDMNQKLIVDRQQLENIQNLARYNGDNEVYDFIENILSDTDKVLDRLQEKYPGVPRDTWLKLRDVSLVAKGLDLKGYQRYLTNMSENGNISEDDLQSFIEELEQIELNYINTIETRGYFSSLEPPNMSPGLRAYWDEYKMHVIFVKFWDEYIENELSESERQAFKDIYMENLGRTIEETFMQCQDINARQCIMIFGDNLCTFLNPLCRLDKMWFGEDEPQWYDG
uniref:Ankyrin repeat protein n=1 Tax=viral metagenome TaxID=1070528 RepID=A0A6C0CL55_9ZZZZ